MNQWYYGCRFIIRVPDRMGQLQSMTGLGLQWEWVRVCGVEQFLTPGCSGSLHLLNRIFSSCFPPFQRGIVYPCYWLFIRAARAHKNRGLLQVLMTTYMDLVLHAILFLFMQGVENFPTVINKWKQQTCKYGDHENYFHGIYKIKPQFYYNHFMTSTIFGARTCQILCAHKPYLLQLSVLISG